MALADLRSLPSTIDLSSEFELLLAANRSSSHYQPCGRDSERIAHSGQMLLLASAQVKPLLWYHRSPNADRYV